MTNEYFEYSFGQQEFEVLCPQAALLFDNHTRSSNGSQASQKQLGRLGRILNSLEGNVDCPV